MDVEGERLRSNSRTSPCLPVSSGVYSQLPCPPACLAWSLRRQRSRDNGPLPWKSRGAWTARASPPLSPPAVLRRAPSPAERRGAAPRRDVPALSLSPTAPGRLKSAWAPGGEGVAVNLGAAELRCSFCCVYRGRARVFVCRGVGVGVCPRRWRAGIKIPAGQAAACKRRSPETPRRALPVKYPSRLLFALFIYYN